MNNNIYRKSKPGKCPRCAYKPVASILYGYPVFSDQMEADVKAGKVHIGGCALREEAPKWRCSQCGLLIYSFFDSIVSDKPPFHRVKQIKSKHISELIATRLNHHPNAVLINVLSFEPFLLNASSSEEVEEYAVNPDVVCIEFSIKGETKIGASDVAFIDIRKSEVIKFHSIGE